MRLNEIHLRDPFILPVKENKKYYLYGTNGPNPWTNPVGFDTYVSEDLVEWSGPLPVFRPPHDFWANCCFWAPEVFSHRSRYFMCASFTDTDWSHRRGTQILVANSPLGPFLPHSNGPVTPEGDVCIDGTLFWDDEDQPWMVYCHERMQVIDGLMCAIPLSDDLTKAIGPKHDLFRASGAEWVHPIEQNLLSDVLSNSEEANPDLLQGSSAQVNHPTQQDQYTTDGPFLFSSPDGQLLMLWSSFHKGIYSLGLARSRSGNILGPWTHDPNPIFFQDGGHGMVFRDWDDNIILVLHSPGMVHGEERAVLFSLNIYNDTVTLEPWANNPAATLNHASPRGG